MKKVLFIFLIILLTFSLAFKKTTVNTFPLFGKLIIIDPGHGGADPGSVYLDKYEKDYNLFFSKTLKEVLEKSGATVILTRGGDYDLSNPQSSHRKKSDFDNRIKLINDSQADLYISLHMNYLNDSSYYGAQTFYDDVNSQNKLLAKITQNNFNDYFNYNKKEAKLDKDKYMYKQIKAPGILIEYGFISSAKDRSNLNKENYRNELSLIITKSIVEYFT